MTTKVITKVRIAKKSNNNAATQATAKVRITKKKKNKQQQHRYPNYYHDRNSKQQEIPIEVVSAIKNGRTEILKYTCFHVIPYHSPMMGPFPHISVATMTTFYCQKDKLD